MARMIHLTPKMHTLRAILCQIGGRWGLSEPEMALYLRKMCKIAFSPGRAAGYPNGPPTDPDEPN